MMERLTRLLLGDGVSRVKFQWLVFYGAVVAGIAFMPLQSWAMASNPFFGYRVLIYQTELVWILFGAIGALLAFKPTKGEEKTRQADAFAPW